MTYGDADRKLQVQVAEILSPDYFRADFYKVGNFTYVNMFKLSMSRNVSKANVALSCVKIHNFFIRHVSMSLAKTHQKKQTRR